MQFVEHDGLEAVEEAAGIGIGEEQRQLLRGGEQDIRRIELLALALVRRRIARPRLDADVEADAGHRRFEIARDVDGKRLQRRDVERVDAGPPRALRPRREIDEARQEAGQRLAGAGRRDQQRRAALARLFQEFELVRARRPAAQREPVRERRRQEVGGGAHGQQVGLGGRQVEPRGPSPSIRGAAPADRRRDRCSAQPISRHRAPCPPPPAACLDRGRPRARRQCRC